MTTKSSSVVYLTASNETERDALLELLAPHSWASGELGLMLTDVAFECCVESITAKKKNTISSSLQDALEMVLKTGAGDVCVNAGVTG